MSDKFMQVIFDAFPDGSVEVITVGAHDTAPAVDPVPPPKQIEVVLEGASIATVDIGRGRTKLVIFRPTKRTHQLVRDYEGYDVDLSIEDVNGLFCPKYPQMLVDSVYERGNDTMIVTTENQS